jgi:hypothetical protein
MKSRKLAATTIWASLWFMFVGICLYYFLLFPAKTATLVGSSAHWKAEDFVEIIILDNGWHATSMDELKVWWTGTPDGPSKVRCQITTPTGEGVVSANGPFNPWVMDSAGFFLTGRDIKYGMSLTLTWDGSTETLRLQKR